MRITEKLPLDKDEIYRYLGITGELKDQELKEKIDSWMQEVQKKVVPKYVYRMYDFDDALVDSHVVLSGNDVVKHMQGANKAIIMAVTLGLEIEQLLKRASVVSKTDVLIIDAISNEYIEKACDYAQEQATPKDCFSNMRFSPGYGDWALSTQKSILDELNAYKTIGLMCTSDSIMIPRKSVTAIWGLFDEPQVLEYTNPCHTCLKRETCELRKRGVFCGK